MKIIIQEAGGRPIKIVIPTSMALNPLTAVVTTPIINKKLSEKLSEEDDAEIAVLEKDNKSEYRDIKRTDMIRLFREVNRIRKKHRGLPLVDAEEKNGDKVKIYL